MPVRLSVEQKSLKRLVDKLAEEEDGEAFRRSLSKEIRTALVPVKQEAVSRLMAIGHSGGSPTDGQPLRAYVAGQVKVEARLTGRASGGRIKVRRRGPRGFELAARRLNRKTGWRHPVYGRDRWVQQIAAPPEWFDRATRESKDEVRRAVVAAMEDLSKRIAR